MLKEPITSAWTTTPVITTPIATITPNIPKSRWYVELVFHNNFSWRVFFVKNWVFQPENNSNCFYFFNRLSVYCCVMLCLFIFTHHWIGCIQLGIFSTVLQFISDLLKVWLRFCQKLALFIKYVLFIWISTNIILKTNLFSCAIHIYGYLSCK